MLGKHPKRTLLMYKGTGAKLEMTAVWKLEITGSPLHRDEARVVIDRSAAWLTKATLILASLRPLEGASSS